MKAILFNIKMELMVCALMFLCFSMYAQSQSVFHALSHEDKTRQLRTTFTSSDTITLEGIGDIYSLSIDATIHQPQEASFTRIVLEDKDGHDYLVAESNGFRYDTTTVSLDHYCEETAVLNGITPACLKCYMTGDASVTLVNIHTSNQPGMRKDVDYTETIKRIKEDQVKAIVDKINDYNTRHGRLWMAAVTECSLLPFNEKKYHYENEYCNPYLNNIQYYAGGLFEIGTPRAYTDTIVSPFVPSFDWRNRHGKNWLTPVKNQKGSFYCVPFAAVSMLESNLLLHYKYEENDTSSINLSEQYVASYSGVGYNTGTYNAENQILFLKTDGTIDDATMPFADSANYTPPTPRPEGVEHVYLNDYDKINLNNLPIDTLKKYIIQKGPGVCGYYLINDSSINQKAGGHAMTLAGYGLIVPDTLYCFFDGYIKALRFHEGDSLIGHTYWIYKNSWGISHGGSGYMYAVYHHNDGLFMNRFAYFPKGKPSSRVNRAILCEDLDGDGYVNWGIDSISPGIAVWAQSDGDDSDPTIGHMNEFGYCEQLPSDHPTYEYIYNDSTLTTSESRTSYLGVLHGATVTLQAQPTFSNGTKMLLDNGATLIIDGFTVNFDFLQPYPGSKIILNNGAKISKPFATPLGVELVINKGSIE